jgi:hypothetical protein
MATGAYFVAFNYKLYVKAGTTASTNPTTSTGMTEVLSLTNAGIQGSSNTQEVTDYGSSQGFSLQLVTGQSYTIPCTMNLDVNSAGYAILKDAALNATTKTVEWYRETPLQEAGNDPEYHSGVAFVTDFSESIESGSVAQVSFTLTGYGAYTHTAETNA